MELRHLHYFIAVAEELHFGRAAARLHIAQPPLSQQIRNLEEELGVLLLERSNRRQVTLTAAGTAFLREARRVLVQVEHATSAAQRAARGLEGELAIGFVGSVTYDLFPRILRVFRTRFPGVQLTLHELKSRDQLRQLRQDALQVGLIRPTGENMGVQVEPLLEEPLLAVLPEHHPLARRDEVALEDLVREPMILGPADGCGVLREIVAAACRKAGLTPNLGQEATELQTRIGLVSSGIGVSLVPASVESFQRRGAVYRPLTEPAPTLELALAWREGDNSALVRSFIDVAREVVSQPPEHELPALRVISKRS